MHSKHGNHKIRHPVIILKVFANEVEVMGPVSKKPPRPYVAIEDVFPSIAEALLHSNIHARSYTIDRKLVCVPDKANDETKYKTNRPESDLYGITATTEELENLERTIRTLMNIKRTPRTVPGPNSPQSVPAPQTPSGGSTLTSAQITELPEGQNPVVRDPSSRSPLTSAQIAKSPEGQKPVVHDPSSRSSLTSAQIAESPEGQKPVVHDPSSRSWAQIVGSHPVVQDPPSTSPSAQIAESPEGQKPVIHDPSRSWAQIVGPPVVQDPLNVPRPPPAKAARHAVPVVQNTRSRGNHSRRW